jgi:hypothetical protein
MTVDKKFRNKLLHFTMNRRFLLWSIIATIKINKLFSEDNHESS